MKQQLNILLLKAKASIHYIIAALSAFLIPIIPLILTVGGCIALDTLVGIWRAKKQKEQITSRKLSHIVSKMVLYQSALILIFAIEKYMLADIMHTFIAIPYLITKMVATTLCVIELKSVDENYTQISGVSIFGKFKSYLTRAKELKEEVQDLTK